MKREPKHTTRAKVKSALRLLWLRSPERARVLKDDKYTCQNCGKKQSKAKGKEVKVEVHHTEGIEWNDMVDNILFWIFQSEQITLCEKCHDKQTRIEKGVID